MIFVRRIVDIACNFYIKEGINLLKGKIYLDVPFKDKDEAKKLGAKWNPKIKKWYYDGNVNDYSKFSRWILENGCYEKVITRDLAIIEGERICYRCGKTTTVMGYGLYDFVYLTYDEEDERFCIRSKDYYNSETANDMFISWFNNEVDIPPLIRRFVKDNYNLKMGYSSIAGKYFANHCVHCGSIQGNNYLFDEVDSFFSATECLLSDNFDKFTDYRITYIEFDNFVPLDIDVIDCDHEAFEEYANWSVLLFQKDNNDVPFQKVSYEQLYELENSSYSYVIASKVNMTEKEEQSEYFDVTSSNADVGIDDASKYTEIGNIQNQDQEDKYMLVVSRNENSKDGEPSNVIRGYDFKTGNKLCVRECGNFSRFIDNDHDIFKIANIFKSLTTPQNLTRDDLYWEQQIELLFKAFMFLLFYEAPEYEQNFTFLLELLSEGAIIEEQEETCYVDELFERIKSKNPDHIAVRYYYSVRQVSNQAFNKIVNMLIDRLERLDFIFIKDSYCKKRGEESSDFNFEPFKNCSDITQLKKRYKMIVKHYQADTAGENSEIEQLKVECIMRYINIEYERLLMEFRNNE